MCFWDFESIILYGVIFVLCWGIRLRFILISEFVLFVIFVEEFVKFVVFIFWILIKVLYLISFK